MIIATFDYVPDNNESQRMCLGMIRVTDDEDTTYNMKNLRFVLSKGPDKLWMSGKLRGFPRHHAYLKMMYMILQKVIGKTKFVGEVTVDKVKVLGKGKTGSVGRQT